MTKINARIVADSTDERGNRITSYILTYPRMIHAEVMTHRMFSRNAASSRAIPFEKMVKMVEENPFVPIAWQLDHKGMQGNEYFIEQWQIDYLTGKWLEAKNNAIKIASHLNEGISKITAIPGMRGFESTLLPDTELTKQLCNRLLEPFMWYTCLVTATEYDNFFELRCPKYSEFCKDGKEISFKSKYDVWNHFKNSGLETSIVDRQNFFSWQKINKSGAEIHIQALAEAMWDARNESQPQLLQPGEWHIPFGDQMDTDALHDYGIVEMDNCYDVDGLKVAVAVARCARLSYMTFDGVIDYAKDIELARILLKNKHMSPFEHVAKCMSELEYYSFVKGEYPTTEDQWGIVNYEMYPLIKKPMFEDEIIGENPNNGNLYGWCNNLRGFIPYRYNLENSKD